MCVCVRVRACVRACVCVCMHVRARALFSHAQERRNSLHQAMLYCDLFYAFNESTCRVKALVSVQKEHL